MGHTATGSDPQPLRAGSRRGQAAYHIITGTPGTGKHTMAGLLAGMLQMPVVDLTQVAVTAGLAGPDGTDTDRLASIIPTPQSPSLLVGHLAPHVVRPQMAASVTVLRRSPYELEKVYAQRRYTRHKALENLGAEILDVVAAEAAASFGDITQVDITDRTPGEGASCVAESIRGAYESDHTDWLDAVCKNGDIGRFFEMGNDVLRGHQ